MSRIHSTLVDLLRWRKIHQSDRLAYSFLADGESEAANLTYGELDEKARTIGAQLQSMGLTGERALLLYEPGLDFIAAYFGCSYAGVVAVPAYVPKRSQQMFGLKGMVMDARVRAALTTASTLARVVDRFEQHPELSSLQWLETDSVATRLASAWREPAVNSDTLVHLQYTSGSTGTPKGVMVGHGNVLHNSECIRHAFEFKPTSISVTWLPHFHDMGLIIGIIQPLYTGFPCVIMPPVSFIQRPIRWLEAISRYKATHSGGPNFAYDLCVRNSSPSKRDSLDLSNWELAFNGAEPVRPETLDQFAATFKPYGFRKSAFSPGYGLAEATVMVSIGHAGDEPVYRTFDAEALGENRISETSEGVRSIRRLVGVGRPWMDTKIVIVNPESLAQCAPTEVGEVWTAGASVAKGYWNRPVETEQTFKSVLQDTGEGPFLRTGDLGFLYNGELFLTGRRKELIIIRGRNHYPQDIESTVQQCHPALRFDGGAALGVDIGGIERLVVVQEIERSHLRKLNEKEVIGAIRRAVAEQHDAEVYAVILLKPASLPKTSSGKIRRNACRDAFQKESLRGIAEWRATLLDHDDFQMREARHRPIPQSVKSGNRETAVPIMADIETSKEGHGQFVKAEGLEAWLIEKVSQELQIPPDTIETAQPLHNYGLSSLAAVRLSGELQEQIGRRISPTLLYDYPSIEALVKHLSSGIRVVRQHEARPLFGETNRDVHAGSMRNAEPIAIIGMSCCFPGADNPEAFWLLLRNGIDAIKEVPASRWRADDYYDPRPATTGKMNSRWGGFLPQVDLFDAQFFGISPREARQMDPQQRLVMEVSWKALENAAQAPEQLAGSQTGVFIGISSHDYSEFQFSHIAYLDAYSGTGSAQSIAANRLSYLLDLLGPSWAVDTACSSSLVAVHQACQSLSLGECEMALAGGVNLILTPQLSITFSHARMMAADGRCKTFDSRADGYVRGEGCGIVVLKRLSEALRDGDNILALIRGSAVNQDGLSNGLTAPKGTSQQAVIRQALKNAGVAPTEISYLEAHGTGTPLGDQIEVSALKEVLIPGRSLESPCWIGSVKTNIGHLEAAAGIAGLIKTVLSLQHEEIPPHLHLQEMNPQISLEDMPLLIPTSRQPWPAGKGRRLAGVSSFGFGGTNAHVILEEAPVLAQAQKESQRPKHLMTLSAKSKKALRDLVQRYVAYLRKNHDISVADVCATANTGRSHFDHRLAVITDSSAHLRKELYAFLTGEETICTVCGEGYRGKNTKIAFLFTGQGSQYAGMGRELYQTHPLFRATINRCDEILRAYLGRSLLEVFYSSAADSLLLSKTRYVQPAIFALEYALAELWMSWGIEPAVVMGHSLGEYVAACIAGVFSLEDGLKLVAERGRLIQTLPENGQMAAVFADLDQVSAALLPYGKKVSIAAVNGLNHIVISGHRECVKTIRTDLEGKGIKTRMLNTSHAFHCALVEPVLEHFGRKTMEVAFSSPRRAIISNITGRLAAEEMACPEYWTGHLRETVRFAGGMQTLRDMGCRLFLEIGPEPTLLGMGARYLGKDVGVWLPSLRKGSSDWEQLLLGLGNLYVRGVSVDWCKFEEPYPCRRLQLPNYPFQKQHYWIQPYLNEASKAPEAGTSRGRKTEVVDLLERGDVAGIMQLVLDDRKVSEEEMGHLQELIEVLVKNHQEELPTRRIDDCLYELTWRLQGDVKQQTLSGDNSALSTVREGLLKRLAHWNSQQDLMVYRGLSPRLEVLSVAFVTAALQDMGWQFQIGKSFSTEEMAQRMGVVRQYHQLLNRFLEILSEVGTVKQMGRQWQFAESPPLQETQKEIDDIAMQFPTTLPELALLERCGKNLAKVLRGELDALELLFPPEKKNNVASLYQTSPAARVMNDLVQKAVLSVLGSFSRERRIRILEIGAGTGGTTSLILPQLEAHQTEYVFTDISNQFITQARAMFREYQFIKYATLDIEQEVRSQGFDLHQYDIVVAANVLHATRDLRDTLEHVQSLLIPGGIMILLEAVAPMRWLDLVFGLTKGWWRFEDLELRPSHPLLSIDRWQELLKEAEFQQTETIAPHEESAELLHQQAVILARTAEARPPAADLSQGGWIIFADEGGVGLGVAELLRSKGEACVLAFSGSQYEQLEEQTFRLNFTDPGDFRQLLQTAGERLCNLRGVVHLWSLDVSENQPQGTGDLEQGAQKACGSALYLLQSLVGIGLSTRPSLWLVTRGTQAVGSRVGSSGVIQSTLWGLGQVIAQEHPELRCVTVDLDPAGDLDQSQALFEELWARTLGREPQIALRQGQRYSARLMRLEKPVHGPLALNGDSTYLITGGLGGIGLKLAQWLVDHGARHLVLVGRRGASGPATEVLKAIEQDGARVVVTEADVSRAECIQKILTLIGESMPPLRGIVHAAGVFEDRLLIKHQWKLFVKVLAPKAFGAWNLHVLTKNIPLDFFVLFSSVSSVLGAPGLGNYVAANAFLDALAHHRCALGLPGLTINWGPWEQVGMAEAVGPNREDQWAVQGLKPIDPQQALNMFELLLQNDHPQVSVIQANWSTFLQDFPAEDRCPLISELVGHKGRQIGNGQSPTTSLDMRSQFEDATSEERRSHLINSLKQRIAKVLRISASQIEQQQPLGSLGLDSLMAVELRNQINSAFGVDVPIVKIMEGASVAGLAAHIDELFTHSLHTESGSPAGENRSNQVGHQDGYIETPPKPPPVDTVKLLPGQATGDCEVEGDL